MRSVRKSEKLFLGRDFNGYIRTKADGYDLMYIGFSVESNSGGVAMVNFTLLLI